MRCGKRLATARALDSGSSGTARGGARDGALRAGTVSMRLYFVSHASGRRYGGHKGTREDGPTCKSSAFCCRR